MTDKNKSTPALQGEIITTQREAPVERSMHQKDIVLPVLNPAQLAMIVGQTPDWAKKTRTGLGNKVFTYIPHGYVTDTLNKAFGFDWDLVLDVISDGQMFSIQVEEIVNAKGQVTKTRRHIAVCGHLTIRVHDPNDLSKVITTLNKSGFGSQEWLPSMEFGDALKGARSDLIKTCAYQLGIGLDLYWNERAEVEIFEQALLKEEEQKAIQLDAEKKLKAGYPTNGITLLTRAQSLYQYDGNALSSILEITIPELMKLKQGEIFKCWDKVEEWAALHKEEK